MNDQSPVHPNPRAGQQSALAEFESGYPAKADPRSRPERALFELALDRLEFIVRLGYLHPDYESVEDWLIDFYMDLPWGPAIEQAIKDILASPRFAAIQDGFARSFGFDLEAEFKLEEE